MTRKLNGSDFMVPALLIVLSIVPTIGAAVRLGSVTGQTAVTPDDARFLHAPTAVVIHVISATLYCLLGAFQFSAGFRQRWPGLHRRAGRVLALCGLLTAGSGVWMTVVYEIPTNLQGPLLYAVRVLVGTAMFGSIILGVLRILRRDVPGHEAFMIRAYALGQGAGTQVFVLMPWMLITGVSGGLTRDWLMTLAWAINVVAAESVIRRREREHGVTPAAWRAAQALSASRR